MRGDLWSNTGHQSNHETLAKSSMSWQPCSWHRVSFPSLFLPVSKTRSCSTPGLRCEHGAVPCMQADSSASAGDRFVLGKGSGSCFPFQGKCTPTWTNITWIICESQVGCIFRVTVTVKAYVANGCSFLLRSELAPVASYSSWWSALKSRSVIFPLLWNFYNPHCNVPIRKKTKWVTGYLKRVFCYLCKTNNNVN